MPCRRGRWRLKVRVASSMAARRLARAVCDTSPKKIAPGCGASFFLCLCAVVLGLGAERSGQFLAVAVQFLNRLEAAVHEQAQVVQDALADLGFPNGVELDLL